MTPDAAGAILVVEDDLGIATLQRRRLERAGYHARVATDVDAAMEALGEAGVDLVLMDYRLGTTTGLDLHGRMKAAGYNVPVVIVSGSMDDRVVIDAIRAGVRDVVFKSTDYLDYLPDAVRGVLDQSNAASTERMPGHEAATILVVEDDAGIAALERRQLERAGHHVIVAAGADEALAIVDSAPVTLAVLDLRLGDNSSGIDLYEQIKASGRQLPAILVTAFPDQTVAIRALRAGIRDFIPKTSDYLEYLPAAIDRIVAQVRVERQLVESELRLASIIGAATDAILMCDDERRVLLFNRSAEELFGCSAAHATQQTVDQFIPGLALTPVLGLTAGSTTTRGGHRLDIDGVRADGRRVPLDVSISEFAVHGRPLFTVIARDVTERRQIEAELREADRRKDEFLGMLAHELRNPLAAITGAGEVLHQSLPDARLRRLTDVVRRQTRILARMVDDLLDVSRVTLGKIRISMEPLLLQPLVTRTVESVRDAAARARLTIDVEAEPAPIRVIGDTTRLEQVLSNLLHNAIKFTPAGGQITVQAARDADAAVLRVRDTGIGMDPAFVPKVFDLFVQSDTSLARSTGGLGIGLALVRQVVALHGGQVSAASEGPGQGSEFIVRLPLAPHVTVTDAGTGAAARTPGQPLTILVVDDQPDVADTLALLLQAMGHTVQTVYDGASGLEAAQAAPPDVMFVDIGMPGMTGYELAAQVRQDTRLARLRLVAVTGYGREDDRARALAHGFDRHLTKPVVDTVLRDMLAGLIAEQS